MDDDRMKLPRGVWWAVGGLVFLLIVGSILSFYFLRAKMKTEVAARSGDLEAGAVAFENLDFGAAAAQFKAAAASSSDFQGAAGFVGLIMHGNNPIASFIDLSRQLATLSGQFADAENSLFGIVSDMPDAKFVDDLTGVRETLRAIDADAESLGAVAASVKASLPKDLDLLSIEARLHGAETFLDVFLPWFADPTPHHVLVLLQNPSELRPTGGFLGSYADLTIASGTIADVSVHDIADVDAGFTPKVVPPKQLQLEVSKWRPADANWFFDFPTSAAKVISFFEESKLYAASGTRFDGAIALSPKVVSDLLAVTGPITVSSSKVQFDSADFLIQIQNIVQTGQAQSATYPKRVLKDLARAIFGKFASATDVERQRLTGLAGDWFSKKDVMAYFKDPAFEDFFRDAGVGGEVYVLPQNFEGDYLAIASTNINGQKSDLSVSENVTWQSQLNDDGTASDHLAIVRSHAGDKSPYWWYRAANQSYIQLFLPLGTTLESEVGAIPKKIPPPVNYGNGGYVSDPLILAIESSTEPVPGYAAVGVHPESGMSVFGAWSRVAAGSSSTLSFDYSHRLHMSIADGTSYEFIFEKQPGTNRRFHFEINAPLGYVFEETGIASWTFDSDDPPGRMVVDLTLQKI